MFIRFDMIHERDRQTDTQTDTQTPHDDIGRAHRAAKGLTVILRIRKTRKLYIELLF